MKNVARSLLAFVTVFFLGPGLMLIFSPETFATRLMIEPIGVTGLSHMRALLGGAIAAMGFSALIAAITADISQARPVLLYIACILVARIVSFWVDGPFPGMALYVVSPVIAFGVLLTAHKLLDKAPL